LNAVRFPWGAKKSPESPRLRTTLAKAADHLVSLVATGWSDWMRAGSYYWRWLRTAFRHSLGPIDLWAGIAAAVLTIIDHYIPERQLMTALAWQIPIWALASIMLVRLLVAPYWMNQEDNATIAALKAGSHDSKRNELRIFYNEISLMLDEIAPLNKMEDVPLVNQKAVEIQVRINSIDEWILKEMGKAASHRFSERSRQQHVIYGSVVQPHYNVVRSLEQIRENLKELISNASWHGAF
jgi:hypothetical protein